MQFANFFTIGGSLSVNANGIDPHFGPLIETVHSLKIMKADGTIVAASRTEHEELFRLAIGGYGLFGIILEATLEVVKNNLYQKESRPLTLDDYLQELPRILNDPATGFHYGQLVLSPWGDKLFNTIRSITFKKIDVDSVPSRTRAHLHELYQENLPWLRRTLFYYGRYSSLLKALQRDADRTSSGSLISRNNIMSPHVSHMYYDSDKETDLLQEYFVPVAHLGKFLTYLDHCVRFFQVNLINAHVRFIPQTTESYISYAQQDCMGIVILFSQSMTHQGHKTTEQFTRALIDKAIALDAAYYLPIQLHATKEQLKKVYPRIEGFFELKKSYDPQELFMNHFYKKYV